MRRRPLMSRRPVRVIAALYLLAVATVCGLVAWGALSNLWAGYLDSPASTYIVIGAVGVAACACSLVAAIRLLRRQ